MNVSEIVEKLADPRLRRVSGVLIVVIDGHGGSGKSTLAEILGSTTGSTVIQVDDFASNLEDVDLVEAIRSAVLEPIREGETDLNYEARDFWYGQNPRNVHKTVTNTVILEGVGSSRTEFRRFIGLSIFVDTPLETCRRRGLDRDLGQTPLTDEELEQRWDDWHRAEIDHFAEHDSRNFADLMVAQIDI